MSKRDEIGAAMPALLRHEGTWAGTYRTIDLEGRIIEQRASRVACEFPDAGDFHYVQRNHFEWPDGRIEDLEFGGVLEGDRLFWDTPAFRGYGWTTLDDVILLTLDRKDVPNASFTEIIVLGDANNRARTWHWFRDGRLYQRTLCDEWRVD